MTKRKRQPRVPGTTIARDHRLGGSVIANPDWTPEMLAKAARGDLSPACHDRTPCIDIRCSCGATGHLHLSQIENAPEDSELAMRCYDCRQPVLPGLSVGTVCRALRGAYA